MNAFWKTIVVILSLQAALNAWLVNAVWERLELVTDVVLLMADDIYEDEPEPVEEEEPDGPKWEV